MSSITIQVPKELAVRLRPYRKKLPEILELGLAQVESQAESKADLRERTLRVLESTGLIRPLTLSRYIERPQRPRRTPLKIPGKPLSEIIIEQRGKL
ncbi:MAG: hypothetical protein KGJ80_02455 [Chloroflexota bacterium]|nr:hypothetical protein [Chloroflexota bacterium]